jgi:hypothetical protein
VPPTQERPSTAGRGGEQAVRSATAEIERSGRSRVVVLTTALSECQPCAALSERRSGFGSTIREKRFTLPGIVLALIATTAGCSGGSDEAVRDETSTTVTIKATPAEASRAMRCLDVVGLSNVEEDRSGLWSGRHDGPAYRIVVRKLMKPAKTPRVVAGEYAVTGSFKVVAFGGGFMGDDGIQADALVQTVADCVGG